MLPADKTCSLCKLSLLFLSKSKSNLNTIFVTQCNKTKFQEKSKPWLSTAALQRFYSDSGEVDTKQRSCSPCSELSRRDEGDGRSIADSQCSAGSYKRGSTLRPPRTYDQESRVLGFIEDSGEEPAQPVPRVRALHPPPPPIPTSRTTSKLHPPTEC